MRVQGTQNGARVDVEDLKRTKVRSALELQCVDGYYGASFKCCLGRSAFGGLTWMSPVSSPATTSFPSPRMDPLLATSLNLEIVLVTFCVLGAYIWTLVAAVTAYLCGFVGEK